MTWTETKSDTFKVRDLLTKRFTDLYKAEGSKADTVKFYTADGVPFSLHVMGADAPFDFIVIEYEDTGEDGDAFFPEDYDTIDDMITAMQTEIDFVS